MKSLSWKPNFVAVHEFIYRCKKYFQPFFSIFLTQNKEVSISFCVYEGLKKKINANFSIWGSTNAKTAKIVFYTYINLWIIMKFGFQDQLLMKKPRKNLQGVLLVNVGLARSSEMHNMYWRLHFKDFLGVFKNPKILQESSHILSQYGAT